MDTEVDGGAFAGFDDLLLDLFAHLVDHLFDTCRVDASVKDELMQCQPGHLTPHGVEA